MPKLFKKFDTDNNGELELEEFCVTWQQLEGVHMMHVSVYHGFSLAKL